MYRLMVCGYRHPWVPAKSDALPTFGGWEGQGGSGWGMDLRYPHSLVET